MKIKMPNPSQEPPASSKAPNEDLKDIDVLCTFNIKIESKNSDYGCIKDRNHQCPQCGKSGLIGQFQNLCRQSKFLTYMNFNQDAKPTSGSSNLFNLRLIIAELSLLTDIFNFLT